MKRIVLTCLVAMALVAPASGMNYNDKDVQVFSYENVKISLVDYKNGLSQADTKPAQKGKLKDEDNLEVKGSFSWIAPNGRVYHVNYDADDGYQSEMDEGVGHDPILVGSMLG